MPLTERKVNETSKDVSFEISHHRLDIDSTAPGRLFFTGLEMWDQLHLNCSYSRYLLILYHYLYSIFFKNICCTLAARLGPVPRKLDDFILGIYHNLWKSYPRDKSGQRKQHLSYDKAIRLSRNQTQLVYSTVCNIKTDNNMGVLIKFSTYWLTLSSILIRVSIWDWDLFFSILGVLNRKQILFICNSSFFSGIFVYPPMGIICSKDKLFEISFWHQYI